ncbi:DUF4145 domain-containing protein [Caulobacter rhizosphaerae]|jgi:hypothetical protein|uniref:DUF4145 domain-containing protein n=1 Tax=Caulobacter rhizosphaerae TaxID=2010972 RepID=UPI0013D5F288|nr:DUF4145 domain-containing protein [Caulobacter rhizosphaerae]GGL28752.1 hypothetical protein GCM10010983_27690 [Caulobacter rhizosphaerae]
MVSAMLNEQAALDNLESRWTKRGYQVIRRPSADQLPGFLRGFQPDAIAVGAKPQLVIEVMQRGGGSTETKLKQLQSLFSGQADWRLEVVYATADGAPLETITPHDIRTALGEARRLSDDAPRSALMMAWASLEAIGRRLEPTLAARSLSTGSLIDLLISTGHLPQTESALLFRLSSTRNAVAHGQLDLTPAPADVRRLVDLGERLVA